MKKQPTVVDVLKRMKALLRKGWTQRTFARAANGRKMPWESPKAVRFCLLGAENRAACEIVPHKRQRDRVKGSIYSLLAKCSGNLSISNYNDHPQRKKEEVIAVVDCAIKAATK